MIKMKIFKIIKKWIQTIFWKKVRWEELSTEYKISKIYGEVYSLPYLACTVYAIYPFNWIIRIIIKLHMKIFLITFKI